MSSPVKNPSSPVFKDVSFETFVVKDDDGKVVGTLKRTEPYSPTQIEKRTKDVAEKALKSEKKIC